jgi:ankyrin repeat protein
LLQLLSLCRAGKLYEVEHWIAQGNPIHAPPKLRTSPLLVAIDRGFHSLVELLLKSGADPLANGNALQRAVRRRHPEIAELLIRHGMDLTSVRMREACYSGSPELVRLFLEHGGDPPSDDAFAEALLTGNKAMLGIYRSYVARIPSLQQQADIALRYCCEDGRLGGVCRLLWAGANPRAKVPSLA